MLRGERAIRVSMVVRSIYTEGDNIPARCKSLSKVVIVGYIDEPDNQHREMGMTALCRMIVVI
jgi:hypothetical protein